MCGIAGCMTPAGGSRDELQTAGQRMGDALAHRGPDDQGVWINPTGTVVFAHRRLSILDLSSHGHQPMSSANGRYTITYNGEVYNSPELRIELEQIGHAFHGSSDTEVLLAAISEWGLNEALHRCNGMFAFGLWDEKEQRLTLVRDRMGIKPLYYGWAKDGTFLFASELKAARTWPAFDPSLDFDALAQYFRHNYIPSPATVYSAMRKLPPGGMLTLDRAELAQRESTASRWWSLERVWSTGMESPFAGTENEAVDTLEHLLSNAVCRRKLADVPLGTFLSGGVDSSAVTALLQQASSQPVRTFSIGFGEAEFDEMPMARKVADHLGTDHTEYRVTEADALAVIPELPHLYDEPFADSSQIPTILVSRLARRDVTTILSGDGGDELFSGYARYTKSLALWQRRSRVPGFALESMLGPILQRSSGARLTGHLLDRMSELLSAKSFSEFYGRANTHQLPLGGLLNGPDALAAPFTAAGFTSRDPSSQLMSLLDLMTYIPGDILTKVDRASMSIGLEARVPLLDYTLVEFASSIPDALRYDVAGGKKILREVVYRHIPRELIDRPKMGFAVPLEKWLKGELRDWAEDLLSEQQLKQDGLLDVRAVRRLWEDQCAGHRQHASLLWNVLMLQAWRRHTSGPGG
jgi:asparagine synthase (glutamine-hydrolysing)